MNTMTLASIYESQGYKKEAYELYWKIYDDDPSNEAALKAIERIIRSRRSFNNPNKNITKKFIYMNKKAHYRAFEKWLAAC